MPDAARRLEPHAARFLELREQLIRILGAQTVDLLIERAAVEITPTYPEMSLIVVDAGRFDLRPVEAAMESRSDEQVSAAFEALTGVVLLILARLLGKEVATRLVRNGASGTGG